MSSINDMGGWPNTPEKRLNALGYLKVLRSGTSINVQFELDVLEELYWRVTTAEEKAEIRQRRFIEELKS